MIFEPGHYYWIKGQGVCKYSHATGGLAYNTGEPTHVVNPYQFASNKFEGYLYIETSDITRPASEKEAKSYKAAVRRKLTSSGVKRKTS